MADEQVNIVLYHSAICPRCQLSKLALGRVLAKYPRVNVEKVEILTNMARARKDGVRSIPALAARGRLLTGVLLTPRRIARFLESVSQEAI